MSRRSRALLPISFVLLAAALAGSAPMPRWCPIPWESVDPSAYLACAAGFSPGRAECEATTRSGVTSPDASCEHDLPCPAGAACPLGEHCDRAYCLDDPMMASGLRATAPDASAPIVRAAVVHAIASLAPPAPPLPRLTPAAEARPPTAGALLLPPVRGPPALLV